jgi:hypothetical protein
MGLREPQADSFFIYAPMFLENYPYTKRRLAKIAVKGEKNKDFESDGPPPRAGAWI